MISREILTAEHIRTFAKEPITKGLWDIKINSLYPLDTKVKYIGQERGYDIYIAITDEDISLDGRLTFAGFGSPFSKVIITWMDYTYKTVIEERSLRTSFYGYFKTTKKLFPTRKLEYWEPEFIVEIRAKSVGLLGTRAEAKPIACLLWTKELFDQLP